MQPAGGGANPFAHILAVAQQTGIALPQPATSVPPLIKSTKSLVGAAEAHAAVLARVQGLRALKGAHSATDVLKQQDLCKLLQLANTNNKAIVLGQQEIAARVRTLKSRECIPVERHQQQQFVALLHAVFQSGPLLRQLYEDIAWAISATDPGSVWEDRLQPLLAALASCLAYEAALMQQEEALARVAPVVAGAAAGGMAT
ncbi:hypothetical protein TSOC_008128 [Tetrabaena socialis]|uniref:Uncharacterized protein n=1 Tax=Tetrabaena socialis TaxID=47790 RepID=A0A2J7ZZE1_9CHLO|nr:hypothetical protein TSOC_008128 [Tetrabaena socialis]|eukprot:PNH05635.1 hypothetical protein TSOC_008128 [Tetrabaena socialis]